MENKPKWVTCNESFEKDRAYGFSWPQRNYRCSFCKREFKSAQALGGHMNVHRRDRPRTNLSSPSSWESPNPNPNPNPNPVFSLLSSLKPKFLPYNLGCHSLSFTGVSNSALLHEKNVSTVEKTLSAGDRNGKKMITKKKKKKKKNEETTAHEPTSFTTRNGARVIRKGTDLNLGMIKDVKEDLDLELRLGYTN